MVSTLERAPEQGFVDLIVGVNYGDEGKGNTVDRFLTSGEYHMAARFNGGANAGHQLVINGQKLALHQVPSGIAYGGKDFLNLITPGSLVDPEELLIEFDDIADAGLYVDPHNLVIADSSHFVLPHHKTKDRLREAGSGRQGTTAKGISFAAGEKYERIGARPELLEWDIDELHRLVIEGLVKTNQMIRESGLSEEVMAKSDLRPVDPEARFEEWMEAARAIEPYIADTFPIIQERLDAGQNMLAEAAQSTGLDIDHGIFPLGTSSHATPGGALNGIGFGPERYRKIVGVSKVTLSRVDGGKGPFRTEIKDWRKSTRLRGQREDPDGEYGATSGRARRMGWPDNTLINRARGLGINALVLTKLDNVPRFGRYINIAVGYDINGKQTSYTPNSARKLAAAEPIYKTLPTWRTDISGIRDFDELPQHAKDLVAFIQNDTRLPVIAVGVGPDREQVIFREQKGLETGKTHLRVA